MFKCKHCRARYASTAGLERHNCPDRIVQYVGRVPAKLRRIMDEKLASDLSKLERPKGRR